MYVDYFFVFVILKENKIIGLESILKQIYQSLKNINYYF
ncbi:hypothetical protein LEP1GSC172_4364 [Leptospira noguchii]|uniref:Uncharacterized protein n=1 Tax=Leptospira noguchii TaxID=28182 RepID=M6VZ08_9LEPT|nr:hypothetical protein LEP1GSC172_4364 [Leptospira noguchii]